MVDSVSGSPTVRVDVLGGVRAYRGDEPLRLGGAQVRALVAALVLANGQVVSVDQLVEAIWEESPPRAVRPALHSYIAKLRALFEPDRAARAEATVLISAPGGYALVVADDAVDARRFAANARTGARALREGRLAEALAALDAALAEWGEPPYGDLAERSFLAADVARLRELWISAREDRAEAALALGADASLHADLDELTREQPLRERGWELRVRALYRDGRQADALAALRTVRSVLREELGIDPGPGLQQLERDVLAGVPDPGATGARPTNPGNPANPASPVHPVPPRTGAEAETPVRPATADHRGEHRASPTLPAPLTPLLGRAAELADLRDALAAHRLVTLVGPGGVGKTRLALAAAGEEATTGAWSAGPWFVELSELTSPALLAVTVAGALGAAGVQRTEDLVALLREATALIVLDNCEHLLDATAALTGELLRHCPGVRVLATSREALIVPGERLVELGPLAGQEPAIELFVSRALAVAPRWRPTGDERDRIAKLCAELDNLPLAIELAAARSRTLSVDEIAESLHDRFALLVGGPRTGPERLRSLEASVSLSVEELTDAQRRLFAILSVFSGGFDLAAARAVAVGTTADVEALLAKSLVTFDPAARPRRFGMLESLRQYGHRMLPDASRAQVRAGHRAWIVDLVESADRRWLGREAAEWFARVRTEQANVRVGFESALADGDTDAALRLAGALGWYWYRFGQITEGIGWASAALEAAGDGPNPYRPAALIALGPLQYLAGLHGAAASTIGAALAEGDPGAMTTKYVRARAFQAYLSATDPAAATAVAEQALDEARAWNDGPGEAEALMALGQIARLSGAPERAAALLEQSVAVARRAEHGFAVGSAGWILVKTRLDRGEADRAVRGAVALSRFLEAEPDVTSELVALHALAGALGMAGNAAAGARLLGAVSALGGDVGFQPQQMDPADSERNVRLVRASLSSQAFAEQFRIGMLGRRAVVEEVLESAAAEPDPLFDRSARWTA